MVIELFKLSELSGWVTSFYSVYYNDRENTLYDKFFQKYLRIKKYRHLMGIANKQIKSISIFKGARDHFFKPHDPHQDDKVCYLYFGHWHNARLYCIRYSDNLVVIGSGGLVRHGKGSKAVQKKIDEEIKKMTKISKLIKDKMDVGDIKITSNGKDFSGNLIIENNG